MTIFRIVRKFGCILTKHQKVRIMELAVLMIFGGFLEMMSVTMILPFMNAVTNPEKVMSDDAVQLVCRIFRIQDYRMFLVFLALVMAGVYILKNIFLLFQMKVQKRFALNNMFITQQQLFHNFLLRSYDYFLNVKSGEIIRMIGDDTRNVFMLLTNLLSLFSELVVTFILIGTIFVIAPGVTLGIAALLLILSAVIVLIIRPVLSRAGIRNRDAQTEMNQWLLQAVQGIKDVKITQKERFFESNYKKNGQIYIKTTYQNEILSMVPRFMIEAVAMAGFFCVIAVLIAMGTDLEAIIPMLSGVAVAAVRLLPSVNRISQGMAGIAFGEPAADKLIENLNEANEYDSLYQKYITKADKTRISKLQNKIEFLHISYKYPAGKRNVLSDASFVIHKGESVGIKGASGAGKTTAVDMLLGLLSPQKGKILVDGSDIQSDMKGWLDQIGYIPQSIFMLDADVRQNVAFGAEKGETDDERVWKALEEAAIADDIKEWPQGLDTQIGERGIRLSGGQRQRIGIARALYANPSVLFFDEATSALDTETETVIMDSVSKLHGKKTMIIIAHRLSTLEGCDHIYCVEEGSIQKVR